MERGGCRRRGPSSPETTRPSVPHSVPLAAAGSEVERCIPGSRISMRHVGTDSRPRSEAAALGVRGVAPGVPLGCRGGQTLASRRRSPALPLSAPALPGRSRPCGGLSPAAAPQRRAEPSGFASTTCVAGTEPGRGAGMLAAAPAGPSSRLAVVLSFSSLPQSLKNL